MNNDVNNGKGLLDRIPGPLGDMFTIFIKKRVMRSSAELSYYLVMSVFPFLLCVNYILAGFNITSSSLLEVFDGILPDSVLSVVGSYLDYVTENQSAFMLTTGIVVLAISSSAAFRSLVHIMSDIQGGSRFSGVWGTILSFFVSLIFLGAIYFSALILVTGRWFFNLINRYIYIGDFGDIWHWLRFLIMFALVFAVIYVIYRVTAPKEKPRSPRIIGALSAAVALVIVSMIFSSLIAQSVKYTLIYGSLASIIIVMVWLYLCGIVIIMGNALNIVINKYRRSAEVKEEDKVKNIDGPEVMQQ